MSREPVRYFAKHYQDAYLEDAANPAYPKCIRVTFLAYGRHRANGHAKFKQREIGKLLGSMIEGHFVPADRYSVNRAIKTAIEYGLLTEGSCALCLIVPGHRIEGHGGDPHARCDRHRTVAANRNTSTRTVADLANGSVQPLRQTATVTRGSSLLSSPKNERAADAANPKDLTERKPA